MPLTLDDFSIDNSWTLFLDRDGVINKKLDNTYVKTFSEFEFVPGAVEALALLSSFFKTIIVVTNQQGIGKGLMSENDLHGIHEAMQRNVRMQGGRIDAVYFAPWLKHENHPERKPGIGMAEKARRHFPHINFKKSLMVGDSLSDIEFGKTAGMRTVLIGKQVDATADRTPDLVFPTLKSFADEMLKTGKN